MTAQERARRKRRRAEVLARNGGRCVLCNVAPATTIDHIVPRSRGGSDAIANWQGACADCNNRKGSKLPGEVAAPPPRPSKVARLRTAAAFDRALCAWQGEWLEPLPRSR